MGEAELMTTDVFPIYEVLVNSIFGSVGLALIGVALTIALILFVTRTTYIFLIYWMAFYAMVMFTFYLGTLGLIICFLLAVALLVFNIQKIFFKSDI